VHFNQPGRGVNTETIHGKTVLVVHVPEAQPQDKPIFFKAQGLPKGALRRISSTDQHCTDDDLAVFYQGRQTESFDSTLVADATMADLQPEAIADYRQSRAEANPDAEELRWSDEDLLQSLGCIRRNPQGPNPEAWQPTVAGLMLFGKPVALRRCFPMMRVDYIRVPGREWVPHPDRRFDTIDLRDPLLRLIRRAQAAILDDLPKGFALEEGDLQRQDKPAIPLRVIREALVRADAPQLPQPQPGADHPLRNRLRSQPWLLAQVARPPGRTRLPLAQPQDRRRPVTPGWPKPKAAASA
jgi:ATP-dependent DNA helicase RecG